ncbi:ATP-dependent 6-phosphofructokinase [Rhynchospora pubera]|uniref:ATP-dependent 6-phosphofructokinase n=2 Tax=Rhynchospora pubera TaxID=906938 RepID=A0AAV8DQM7_9POAL|nr:ATP-dependent 6-phosphofructokinase [Rhynchospora pubera]
MEALSPMASPDEIHVEGDFDSPTSRQIVSSLPFSATCIRIARDSYPNLRSISSSANIPDDAGSSKTVEGDFGYVLEDVPHFTDYLPDLPAFINPLRNHPAYKTVKQYWVNEEDSVPLQVVSQKDTSRGVHFRRAGPRQKVYFESDEVLPCIVTCGGLCPGLNTVIRELVCGLNHMYNVTHVLGIEAGYKGFYSKNTVELTPKSVNDIHKRGGTVIGTSRGGHDTVKIVDNIEDRGINQVFIIGGDGTQKGASDIYKEIRRRGLKVAVVGIPKTIDNDIAVIDKSFGFDSAVTEAQRAINAAHVEAESMENGIGLVKLMGRYSGFIAMYATLASRDVDCCLIPESPFYLEGKGGLFEFMEKRLKENGHMVLVVAEGAGQKLIAQSVHSMGTTDESGNRLLLDIGIWLSEKIKEHFSKKRMTINLKYIDPTYMIRAIPSNASDNVYCTLLAQSAIHGAMAGYTGFCVGQVNGRHTYIPFHRVIEKRNRVSIQDRMWARLLSSTNQPSFMDKKDVKPATDNKPKLPSGLKPMNVASSAQSSSKLPPKSPNTPTKSILITETPPPEVQKSSPVEVKREAPLTEVEKPPSTDVKREAAPLPQPPAVNATAVELRTSDSEQSPPHDSESDTQSESGKHKQLHEQKPRVRPQSLPSFGRHSMKSKGLAESPAGTPISMFSPSRPSTPTARGAEGHTKAKEKSGRHPWRLHKMFFKRSP